VGETFNRFAQARRQEIKWGVCNKVENGKNENENRLFGMAAMHAGFT